jgi:opacity protein-like surface antigen
MAVVRHALRLVVVLGTVLAAAGAAAQDVRHSAIPDFDAVAAANRGFGGFYVAGGFGYGLPAHRDFSLVDGFACPGTNVPYLGPVALGGGSGCRTSAGLSGLTAHVVAGWNFGAGQGWISGVELRGRLGREAGTGRLGGSSVVAIPGLAPYTNTASGTYRASIDSGLAVTGRWGYAFSGFMPFLKAGLGMARLSEQVDFDATGSRSCTVGPPVSCTSGGRVASRTGRWLPSAVFGAGVEVPVGRAFVRVDGEVEAVFSPSQNLTQTLAGQTLVTAGGGGSGGVPATVGQASLRSENWIISRRIMISGGFRF